MARRRTDYSCSFCGKVQDQVQRLIAGPNGVYICDECIHLCNEIIAEGPAPRIGEQGAGARWETRRTGRPWWRRLFARRGEWQRRVFVRRGEPQPQM